MISVHEIKPQEEIYWYTRLFRWLRGYDAPPPKYAAEYKIYLEDSKKFPVLCGDIVMINQCDVSLKVILISNKGLPKFIAQTVHPRFREDLDAVPLLKGEGIVIKSVHA